MKLAASFAFAATLAFASGAQAAPEVDCAPFDGVKVEILANGLVFDARVSSELKSLQFSALRSFSRYAVSYIADEFTLTAYAQFKSDEGYMAQVDYLEDGQQKSFQTVCQLNHAE